MTDTRPLMSPERFAERAEGLEDGHWHTGEYLLYEPAIMSVEGWDVLFGDGFNVLTQAQRTLLIWSTIVGQTANGGFSQLYDHYELHMASFEEALRRLEWLEVSERFSRALLERQDEEAKQPKQKPDAWSSERELVIDHLARCLNPKTEANEPKTALRTVLQTHLMKKRIRGWKSRVRGGFFRRNVHQQYRDEVLEVVGEAELKLMYTLTGSAGDFIEGIERDEPGFDEASLLEAEKFDNWFYSDECKTASRLHVRNYILNNRDELYRAN